MDLVTTTAAPDALRQERKGRLWIGLSFIFCPCHLPAVMGVLGIVFGGTAIESFLASRTLAVGIVCGLLYAAGLYKAFHHLRRAKAMLAPGERLVCGPDRCDIEPAVAGPPAEPSTAGSAATARGAVPARS